MKLFIENINGVAFASECKTCHYVYAHGILQDLAGYDIVVHKSDDVFDFKNDRVEDVIAVLPDGTEVPSRLFFWHAAPYDKQSEAVMAEDPVYRCHGLVVSLEDKDALDYAGKRFEERPSHI